MSKDTRGRVGLGDVLRAWKYLDGDEFAQQAVAQRLGYVPKKPNLASILPEPENLPTSVVKPNTAAEPTMTRQAPQAPVPILHVSKTKEIDSHPSPSETVPQTIFCYHFDPQELSVPPKWSRARVATALHEALHTSRSSLHIDLPRVVKTAAERKPLSYLPRIHRTYAAPFVQIFVDRPPRSAPQWADGQAVARWLQRIYGVHSSNIYYGQPGEAKWRIPRAARGASALMQVAQTEDDQPSEALDRRHQRSLATDRLGWTSVVVTDGQAGDWVEEGHLRSEAGEHPVLILLSPPSPGYVRRLRAGWSQVRWLPSTDISELRLSLEVDQLLTVASLAMEVSAGLLRHLRRALGADEAQIEQAAWTHPALCRGSADTAQWTDDGFRRYRQELLRVTRHRVLSLEQFQRAVQVLFRVRFGGDSLDGVPVYRVPPLLWHTELASLWGLARQLLPPYQSILEQALSEDHWSEKNQNFQASYIPNLLDKDKSAIRRLDTFVDYFRVYDVSADHILGPGGPLEKLAQTLRAKHPSQQLRVLQTSEGIRIKTERDALGSPLVSLSGAHSVLLSADTARSILKVDESALSLCLDPVPDWANTDGLDVYGRWASVLIDDIKLKFRWIKPGSFWREASVDQEFLADAFEPPRHQVTLTQGFWLAETPCTQGLWRAVTGDPVHRSMSKNRPIAQVSWFEVEDFIQQLNQRVSALNAQLPTEAEWEYAFRAGADTPRVEALANFPWYAQTRDEQKPRPLGKSPNPWGLCDMLGTVWEWCADSQGDDLYRRDAGNSSIDPVGSREEGKTKALRGGGRFSYGRSVRAAVCAEKNPSSRGPGIGFRLALKPARPESEPKPLSHGVENVQPRAVPQPFRRPQEDRALGHETDGAQVITSGMTLVTDRAEAHLDLFERPAWASYIIRDSYGLYAEVEVESFVPVSFTMRWIPPGTFYMGSRDAEHNEPQHSVQLTQGYWIMAMPCTQSLWHAVMNDNLSTFEGARQLPIESVSWEDIQHFMKRLNERVPGLKSHLPTEAQWEYACRAGTQEARYGVIDTIAWYNQNSGQVQSVGLKAPNLWGLYDTLGNVWEWCADDDEGSYGHENGYARPREIVDPQAGTRVLRGGSWRSEAESVGASCRIYRAPSFQSADIGFRIIRNYGQ